jgi:hypothetical protein
MTLRRLVRNVNGSSAPSADRHLMPAGRSVGGGSVHRAPAFDATRRVALARVIWQHHRMARRGDLRRRRVPNTATPGKREDLRERLAEISYILVPGGLQLYVGTPHSYYSIYAEEGREESGETRPFLDGFVRLCIPILDEGGRSRWPERFSQKIEEIRRHRAG